MWTQLRPAVSMLIFMTLLTGIAYPFAVTGVAQAVLPHQANGSLVEHEGIIIGSELLAQGFIAPKYFWPRPSATSPAYNAAASSGSNLGPTNPALVEAATGRIQALRDVDPGNNAPVPVDLVSASGSGLDPEVSIAAARYQAARIARARGIDVSKVQALIDAQAARPLLPGFGEPRVNVLKLNLALDAGV